MERDMNRGNVTLNDIAALIVQIEPTDLEELAHVDAHQRSLFIF